MSCLCWTAVVSSLLSEVSHDTGCCLLRARVMRLARETGVRMLWSGLGADAYSRVELTVVIRCTTKGQPQELRAVLASTEETGGHSGCVHDWKVKTEHASVSAFYLPEQRHSSSSPPSSSSPVFTVCSQTTGLRISSNLLIISRYPLLFQRQILKHVPPSNIRRRTSVCKFSCMLAT